MHGLRTLISLSRVALIGAKVLLRNIQIVFDCSISIQIKKYSPRMIMKV